MRHTWMLALGAAALMTVTACPKDDTGGGGGEAPKITYDNSNPRTREEQGRNGVPLAAQPAPEYPAERQDYAPNPQGNVVPGHTQVIAKGGEPTLRLDANSASVQELLQVPGINVNLARAIVQYRPYKDAKDMANKVPNLSYSYVQSFDQYLTFGTAPNP